VKNIKENSHVSDDTTEGREPASGFKLQRALFRLTDRLYRASSLAEAYDTALDSIMELLGCERASILQFDANGVMRFVAWRGLSKDYRRAVGGHSPWQPGDLDPAPIFIADIDDAPETEALKAVVRQEGIRALAFVPLMRKRMTVGKFMVYHGDRHAFSEEERDTALLIARQISFCIERQTADFAASRLKALIQSSSDAIIAKDLNGIIQSWNRGAELLFGYPPEEAIGQSVTMLIPPDRLDEEAVILGRIRKGEQMEHYETVRRRKDGSLVPVSLTVSPILDSNGRVLGASKIARNITELHREREKQELLLREMNHRVKNLFAVASSIINLNAGAATSSEARALAASIADRLGALGRAHALTLDSQAHQSEGIAFSELCRAIVTPYDGEGPQRIGFAGEDFKITGKSITPMALLLHEFATNAAKYGSLSSSRGRIEVNCAVHDTSVEISWREIDGPGIAQPAATGFGSRLVQATVAQLDGRLEYRWAANGLEIRLELPRRHFNLQGD
jgi:PAS domain S-box-containing protein